jgi:hypothetical protein
METLEQILFTEWSLQAAVVLAKLVAQSVVAQEAQLGQLQLQLEQLLILAHLVEVRINIVMPQVVDLLTVLVQTEFQQVEQVELATRQLDLQVDEV